MKSHVRAHAYTLIEVMVSVAIMAIMLAVALGTYSLGKQYDSLKLETTRLASGFRMARTLDFNGVVSWNGIRNTYPSGGYGVHINNNDAASNKKGGTTTYTVFADFSNSGGAFYDGVNETIQRFDLPSGFTIEARGESSINDFEIIFKNNTVTIYESTDWLNPISVSPYTMTVRYMPSCPAVKNQKGFVDLYTQVNRIDEYLNGPCP